MANLLTRNELSTANPLAEFYVVYDGKDYRMTFATLLKLVSLTSLGLENVDNTKDLKKPLSEMMIEALSQKANSTDVVTTETYNQLVASLKNYASIDALNLAIKGITDSLNTYVTDEELTAAVNTALGPVTQAMSQVLTEVQAQAEKVALLAEKTNNMVITETMNAAIKSASDTINSSISDLSTSFSQTVQQLDQLMTQLSQSVNALSQAVENKADKDHIHNYTTIEGLEDYVTGLIAEIPAGNGDIAAGVLDW